MPRPGDFGLAKELSSQSKYAYTNVGTPFYMSPELINELRYNEASDIWALGCLLYELTALRAPFEARGAAPRPHAMPPRIDASVASVARRNRKHV